MPDYRLLIFDWDGTLVDSIGRIVEAMHRASDACGLVRCTDTQVKGIIGLGLPEAIATLYGHLDGAAIQAFRGVYSTQYLELEAEPSPLFAGVEESLEAFRQQGYLLAVATGKGRHGLQRVLQGRGWTDYFDATRCADETASKPQPLMLEQLLREFDLPASQALMVGDSAFDLQMAHNAGMDCVAVGYGAQPLDVLRGFNPTLAIEEFIELRRWLQTCAGSQRVEVGSYVG
ncbi:HAD-IA family hydrolase [Pseudomonas sp. M30-35]|uniref:HAD-IA family hydrolase n=1 Tax=Pseudomonas sp. M30-35 TaxID=1981174 RepID=UPI000B3C676E|nr:HAD-IA family hydrolase [Pseudomonas sp. M30-35]ARU88851.1 HAD family hydrolase [Pseudomonas sp. M30-35]